jgi:hypothetical protein
LKQSILDELPKCGLQEEKFELNCPTDFVFISEKATTKESFGRPLGYSGAPFVE